jgi:hypothetical protein
MQKLNDGWSIRRIIYLCPDFLNDGVWRLETKPEDAAALDVCFERSGQFSAI